MNAFVGSLAAAIARGRRDGLGVDSCRFITHTFMLLHLRKLTNNEALEQIQILKKKKIFINNNNPSTETPSTYRQTVHKRPRIFDTSKYIIFHYSTLYTKIKLLLSNNYQYLHLVPTTPDGSRQHRSVAELHVHTYKTFPIRI